MPTGDTKRGAAVFATSCAGCHGADASGGVGPSLADGVPAATVLAVVETGKGVMPAGLVEGQDAADVAAYVASLGK
jgi:cytochrome c551